MDKLTDITILLTNFVFSTYILIVVLRFLLQLVRADFYNPLSQFIVKATNPVLMPLRRIIPGFFGIDFASIVLAIILQVIAVQIIYGFLGSYGWIEPLALVLISLRELIFLILNIYFVCFIVMVVLSFIAPNTYNPIVGLISSLTEPVLRPIRKVIPPMGGLDFSVMVAMIGIAVIKILLG